MKGTEREEFLRAYDEYADAIYRHCFFRVYSKPRAEELMQETFMKTWQYVSEGKEIDNLKAFLYRVANNLIIDESRKRKEESLETLGQPAQLGGEEVVGPYDPPSNDHKLMERDVLAREVLEVVEKLPKEYRDIVIMRFVDDLDPKEIAAIMEITSNNVSVRLNRAVNMVKKNFHAE